jgi:hypothetical protein
MTAKSWDRETAALRALLADLAPPAPSPRDEECETAQMHLDLFVSDELDGVDVRLRHPRLWQHLQLCADCRVDHDRLFGMLAAEIEGRLPALPPRLAPSLPAEPWRLEIVPAPGRPRPALQFIFAPAYLRQSLRPAAAAGLRAADDPRADRLLLSYLGAPGVVPGTITEVMVQLYAQPETCDPQTGRVERITLALVAAGEPMPTAAELIWGNRTWAVALGQDGDAIIGPLSVAELAEDQPDARRATPFAETAFSLRLLY